MSPSKVMPANADAGSDTDLEHFPTPSLDSRSSMDIAMHTAKTTNSRPSVDLKTVERASIHSIAIDEGFELQSRINNKSRSLEDPQTIDEGGSIHGSADGTLTQRNISELAPTDEGFHAWAFLVAAFCVEGVVWAFPTSYGSLLSAYTHDPRFSIQKEASSLLPQIGSVCSGMMSCSNSFIIPLLNRYPRSRRPTLYTGFLICVLSLLGASFVDLVSELLFLQGILYAIGGSLLYAPCVSFMSEWFVRRRGMANGVMFAGTSVGGLFLPIILPNLIKAYGAVTTLRILSVSILIIILPCLPFLRPRLPETKVSLPGARRSAETEEHTRKIALIKNPSFVLAIVCNILQGLAYFVPLFWLPTFASDLNLSDTESSLALALLNGSAVFSRISIGHLSDRMNTWVLAASTSLSASVATFVLWGVCSHNLAGVLAFGIVYGAVASGWSSLWIGFVRPIAKDNHKLTSTLLGVYMATRGIGNILSTPISTSLSHLSLTSDSTTSGMGQPSLGFDVADGKFTKMILYVGTCFAGAGVIALVGLGFETFKLRQRSRALQQ